MNIVYTYEQTTCIPQLRNKLCQTNNYTDVNYYNSCIFHIQLQLTYTLIKLIYCN